MIGQVGEAINTYWSLVEENMYKLNTWKIMDGDGRKH